MLGYGIGIGGPGGAGVLHTSGKTVLIPPLLLCAIPRELAKVVCVIVSAGLVSARSLLVDRDRMSRRPLPARVATFHWWRERQEQA